MIPSLFGFATRFRLIRYLMSGALGAAVHVGTVHILHEWYGVWYLTATTIGFFLAVGISFAMQKFFTFQDHRKSVIGSQSLVFGIVATTNLALNSFLMYTFVEYIRISPTFAQICSALVLAVSSYLLYSKLFTASNIESSTLSTSENIKQ